LITAAANIFTAIVKEKASVTAVASTFTASVVTLVSITAAATASVIYVALQET